MTSSVALSGRWVKRRPWNLDGNRPNPHRGPRRRRQTTTKVIRTCSLQESFHLQQHRSNHTHTAEGREHLSVYIYIYVCVSIDRWILCYDGVVSYRSICTQACPRDGWMDGEVREVLRKSWFLGIQGMIGYDRVLRSMIGHARAYRTRPTGEGKEGLIL